MAEPPNEALENSRKRKNSTTDDDGKGNKDIRISLDMIAEVDLTQEPANIPAAASPAEPTSIEELGQIHRDQMMLANKMYALRRSAETLFPLRFRDPLLLFAFDLRQKGKGWKILCDIFQEKDQMTRFARLFSVSDEMRPILRDFFKKEFDAWLATNSTWSGRVRTQLIAESALPGIFSRKQKYKDIGPNLIPCSYSNVGGRLTIFFEELVVVVLSNTRLINQCSLTFSCFGSFLVPLIKIASIEPERTVYRFGISSSDRVVGALFNPQELAGIVVLQGNNAVIFRLTNIKLHLIDTSGPN